MRPRGLLRFVGTLALGALLLAAQVATLCHQVVVRHAACAEHGEPIHVGAFDGDARGPSGPVMGLGAPTAGHGHEHCQLFVARPAPAAPNAHPRAITEVRVCRVHAAEAWRPVALLLLAPKNSPPPAHG